MACAISGEIEREAGNVLVYKLIGIAKVTWHFDESRSTRVIFKVDVRAACRLWKRQSTSHFETFFPLLDRFLHVAIVKIPNVRNATKY